MSKKIKKFEIIDNKLENIKKYIMENSMKIKVGEKMPSSELFYLDQNNDVKKVDILDLCKDNKIIILGMPGVIPKHVRQFIYSVCKKFWSALKKE